MQAAQAARAASGRVHRRDCRPVEHDERQARLAAKSPRGRGRQTKEPRDSVKTKQKLLFAFLVLLCVYLFSFSW